MFLISVQATSYIIHEAGREPGFLEFLFLLAAYAFAPFVIIASIYGISHFIFKLTHFKEFHQAELKKAKEGFCTSSTRLEQGDDLTCNTDTADINDESTNGKQIGEAK